MDKIKFATVWLAGCSGCHMSFLDLDEWLIDLSEKVELVFSPFMDNKDYPDGVDLCLIEGAVANEENYHFLKEIRKKTKTLVSFGDCALNGNVTALRNLHGKADKSLELSYKKLVNLNNISEFDYNSISKLLDRVRPLHEIVKIDYFLPGCPPDAARIKFLLEKLINNEVPELQGQFLKNG
ncbi:MAG: oxidoreductase [Ignavibacteria bacterium]|jgi:NAD-reducing hydrogenase small subunit|nr:oxidoreductase [Ignavibacteria bacterium]MDH7527842.1 oxidoreductase [Ignavibacteria bacterium]NPV11908.1 oxidoreductase [Ignavibacteria bacterium]